MRLPQLGMALRAWRRNLRIFSKLWRTVLLPPFLDPVLFFVALGFGLGAYVSEVHGVPFRDFIAPAMCASAALWSSSFEGTFGFFRRMADARTHDNMLATPLEPEDVVLSELLWTATRGTIYSSAFLVVIAVLGYVDSAWAVLLPLFLFLGGLVYGAIALAYTVWIPKLDYLTFYFTLVVQPMWLLGGIIFPTDGLPEWAQRLASLLPTEHLAAISRTLANGGSAAGLLADTAYLVAFGTLFALVPMRRLRSRLVA
jgi:lipooligosaccharide transport system permease protein